MHLVIAFLTALVSVLYALDRLGVDIGWLNPWTWRRRRRWLKQYHANPAFNLENPMDVVALLLAAVAKIDGDLSSEEKKELHKIFESKFNQSASDASALLRSSIHLLGTGEDVFNRPSEVLARSLDKFSNEKKDSALELLAHISLVGGDPSESQAEFISAIKATLIPEKASSDW